MEIAMVLESGLCSLKLQCKPFFYLPILSFI